MYSNSGEGNGLNQPAPDGDTLTKFRLRGLRWKEQSSLLVVNGQIARIDTRESFKPSNAQVIDLGDATILPGFIELHAHLLFQTVPVDTVLKHGIATIRDLGGTVHRPYDGKRS